MNKKTGHKSSPPVPSITFPGGIFGGVNEATMAFFDLGIYLVDANLNLVRINQQLIEMFGQTRSKADEFIGRPLKEFLPQLSDDIILSYKQVLKDKKPTFVKGFSLVIAGREIIVEMRIAPLIHESRVTILLTTVRDITESIRTREALEASEKKYRMLVENVNAHISVSDREGVFLYINGSGAEVIGKRPEEVLGKSLRDFFPEEIAKRQIGVIRNVIDTEVMASDRLLLEIKGQKRWFDAKIQPFGYKNGKVVTAMVIAIDVTDNLVTEEALRASEERFRLQFNSLPIPAYIWEHNGEDFILSSYNIAAEKITRGRIPDYIGKTLTEMYGDSPEIVEEMNRCLREKASITREMPYHMKTINEDKFLRLFYVYVPPNLVVAHTEDITEQRRAAKSLQEAHDELEERVIKRTQELAEANAALRVEREALEQKNIALREVLDQIEEGKKQMASQIQSNINRIVMPILKSMEGKSRPAERKYIELLQTSLNEIASPLIGTLEAKFAQLTPRELEVCSLVKNGLSSKEIAETFNTSVQTVLKQRATIRKKLGIAGGKTNLASYLKSLE